MSAYLIRVARAHNLPSLEAPARGTTIDHIRVVPYRQNVVALEKFDSAAPDQLTDEIYPKNITMITDTPMSTIKL